MPRLIDLILKVTIIVAIALASASVSYYYLKYLPDRDVAIDTRLAAERAAQKSAADRQAAGLALQAEADRRRQATEREVVERRKATIQARYDACMMQASASYSADWDATCKRRADIRRNDYKKCLTNGISSKASCDALYSEGFVEKDCSLPSQSADSHNSSLERNKTRCLQEFQAGLE